MRRKPLLIAGVLLALGAGAAALHFSGVLDSASAQEKGGGQNGKGPQEPPPVPITAEAAKTEDVPVYLRGIGTVQALNTVSVRPQVSGVLVAVPVQEGQEVTKGTVLAIIDPRPYKADLDKAVAQRQQDEAQLANAQLDLRRYQELAKSSFAPRQQVDTQAATVTRMQAAIAADQAAIETAQLNLDYASIRAPIDGRVSLRQVDPGNLIEVSSQTTGIFTVTQDHPIAMVFTLPENQLAQVQKARAQTPDLPVIADSPNADDALARGKLLTPNNAVDVATGTIQFKAVFDNQDNKLWPGEFVNARLLVDTLRGVVAVPHIAVQHAQDGLFVFVVKPDNTVERRTVDVGFDDGQTAVIAKGVAAGDKVATGGQSRLGQGVRIALGQAGQNGQPAAGGQPGQQPGQGGSGGGGAGPGQPGQNSSAGQGQGQDGRSAKAGQSN